MADQPESKSIVTFDYHDPVLCVVNIVSTDKREAFMINNYIGASMTFYDKQEAKKWQVQEGFRSAFDRRTGGRKCGHPRRRNH